MSNYEISKHNDNLSLPALRNAILGFRQVEFSHMMENVLYNELCSRGYNVDVGLVETWEKSEQAKTVRKILEVDFVVNRKTEFLYKLRRWDGYFYTS